MHHSVVFLMRCLWWGLALLAGLPARAQAPAPGPVVSGHPVWQRVAAVSPVGPEIPNIEPHPPLQVQATTADAHGNVYVVGSFERTIRLGDTTLISLGSFDVFVAKWTPAGRLAWARRAGGAGFDQAQAVAVQGGRVYVAGCFGGTARFGGTTLKVPRPWTYTDAFVAKLTDAGTATRFVWARQAGGAAGQDEAVALVAQGNSLYVAGRFSSAVAAFGPLALTKSPVPARANRPVFNAFVAKLTDEGRAARFVWAEGAGQEWGAAATALAVGNGGVYVAGNFGGSIAFGPHTVVNAERFGNSAFVARLTDTGTSARFAWAEGLGVAYAAAVAVQGRSVVVAGHFEGYTLRLGNITLANAHATDGHSRDVFVARLADADTVGRVVWAERAGGTDHDYAAALAVRDTGTVYLVGYFTSAAASFGSLELRNVADKYAPACLFVAKLLDTGAGPRFTWAESVSYAMGAAAAVRGATVCVVGTAPTPVHFGSHALANRVGTQGLGFLGWLFDPR